MTRPSPPGRQPRSTLTARGRAVLGAVVALLIVLTVVVVAVSSRGGGSKAAPPSPVSPTTGSPTASSSTPSSSGNNSAVIAAARAATQRLLAAAPDGGAFVAAANPSTGARYTAGNTSGNWTASCYKLVLLEILLLQHQQQGTSLGSGEIDDATRAIENSDNVAGYQLWIDVGRNPGMQAALPTLGLAHAVAEGTDPTFTRVTPPDTLALLANLVSATSPLTATSRSFILGLMRNVETDQRWGAGAAADPHTDFANKNGWLSIDNDNGPGESDDGRWVVNSLGIVTIGGDQVLLAVFSEHNASFDSGVALIEKLAEAVRPIVAG